MSEFANTLSITEILNNCQLRGSLFSTIRCSICGQKMSAEAMGSELFFHCKKCDGDTGEYKVRLNLEEIAAIINFNPII